MTPDRHALYEASVQAPESDIALVTRLFKGRFGRVPMSLREDFCGTALCCRLWAKSRKDRVATGVDLDPEVLAWGQARCESDRVRLQRADVRAPPDRAHEVVLALNYSYWVFRTRAALVDYFSRVREGLTDEGLFLIDAFGGWEAQQIRSERRKLDGFTYVWEQALFNPIDHSFRAHIHFELKGGARIERAFTYDWRLWQMPEIVEALEAAGFRTVQVLWEGTTDAGEGDGRFRARKSAPNDPAWIAYVAAFQGD